MTTELENSVKLQQNKNKTKDFPSNDNRIKNKTKRINFHHSLSYFSSSSKPKW